MIEVFKKYLSEFNFHAKNIKENNPEGWISVEFFSAYQVERFINIIAIYDTDVSSLYNRIRKEWDKEYKSDFWKYVVKPVDYGVEQKEENGNIVEKFRGDSLFKLSIIVKFPKKDLEEVCKNLRDYKYMFSKPEVEDKKELKEKINE